MAKELNNSDEQNSPHVSEDDSEKSFVGKFKSIISNTPLSKWFRKQDENIRSIVRRREDENDEETQQMQPPAKRARFPNIDGSNCGNLLPSISSDNTVINENTTYNHFPAPVPGPSGLVSRKLSDSVKISSLSSSSRNIYRDDLINGHKDSDSEESTSGYSSVARIGSKEHVSHSEPSSKQHSPLQTTSPNRRSLFQSPVASSNRSLFGERTSPNLNTSLSSRRPCFNASTFGSPNFIDKTISTEKIINSPFYNGTTIYGGASAYGSKLGRSARDLRTSLKRSVHIKPNKTRECSNLVLGKTAKKILETLEQYSTPINDAKKIPVASKRFRSDNSLLGKHIGANSYLSPGTVPSKTELQVPSVSDLLKMKQKAKLQSSTEAARQIATSSKPDALSPPPLVKTTPVSEKSEPEKSKEKAKDSLNAEKPQISFGLPISAPSKTDLNISVPVTKKPPEKAKPAIEKQPVLSITKSQNIQQPQTPETNKKVQRDVSTANLPFKFSDPLIIADNLKSIVAMNNFKFSDPLMKINNKHEHSSSLTLLNKNIKDKNNGQNNIKDMLPNSGLLDKFKPTPGTWECSTCLIRNQPSSSKCIACETPNQKAKPSQIDTKKVSKPQSSFGEKFKMPDSQWECPVCMIRNSNGSAKCVACETANPKSATLVSSSTGFQGKFLPPANTWECSTCMIRNKEELTKCAACETQRTPKPAINQLTNSFKIKDDEWECPVCMVRNKSTHAKCQCCEASKPGTSSNVVVKTTEKVNVTKFNFGIDKKTASSFSFGIPPSTVSNLPKPSEVPSVASEDKVKTVETPAPQTFSFGITPTKEDKAKPVNPAKPLEADSKESNPAKIVKSTTENEAIVKPVVSIKETTQNVPTLFKGSSDFVSSTSTSSVNTLKNTSTSFSAKPKFSFSTKSDSPYKDPNTNNTIPKFDFGKPSTQVWPQASTTVQTAQTTAKIQPAGGNQIAQSALNQVASPAVNKVAQVDSPNPIFKFGGSKLQDQPLFGQNKVPPVNNGLESKSIPSFATLPKPPVNAAATKPFSFTQSEADEPPTKATMFNFGQSAGSSGNPNTQTPGFGFGPVTKSPVFNFSASKSETMGTGATSNPFSSGNATGNSKNGIFNFGGPSQNPSQKAGFNFGTPAASPSSGFNFSAAAATTGPGVPGAPAGGFNFTATFDANAKPSFNFSDSPVSFSAQPSAEAAPRKIKKAVRRAR